MILILGTTPDDIIYFQNRMKLEKSGSIRGIHPYYVGRFADKDICVTFTGNSSLMSATITSYMITKFDPYVVFAVGTVYSASDGLKQGDYFIAERVYLGDVDYSAFEDLQFSQVIHMSNYYTSEDSYIKHLERLNSTAGNLTIMRGPLISMNRFFVDRKQAQKVIDRQESYLGGRTAFDTEMGGIVASCRFYEVPWILLKAVSYEIGKDDQLLSFVRKGLEAQPNIGHLLGLLFDFLNHSLEDAI